MITSALLSIDDLRLSFGGIRALDGVNLQVHRGETLGVIGPNGAGKTTLFNAITGVLRPDAGSVLLEGRPLTRLSPDSICRLGVARTYQKVRPFSRLTVIENVMLPMVNREDRRSHSLSAIRREAIDLLARVGLVELAEREARALNLYYRKKIELARAVATGARLLLLDEVMAGLHAVEAESAIALLRQLKSDFGLTIICIEHLMRITMNVSDRIAVLDHGHVIAAGLPTEVAANAQVQHAYLGADYAAD